MSETLGAIYQFSCVHDILTTTKPNDTITTDFFLPATRCRLTYQRSNARARLFVWMLNSCMKP